MPDPGEKAHAVAADSRFVTFRMADKLYALPTEQVAEVIRTPAVARVPQAPQSLLGLANIRGDAVPVASLRGLLGRESIPHDGASRAIVLNGSAPVAVVVDKVERLVSVPSDAIETGQALLAAEAWEPVRGAFQPKEGGEVAKILDIGGMLAAAFVQRVRPNPMSRLGVKDDLERSAEDTERHKLVVFEVSDQDYALDLTSVHEILAPPACVSRAPDADSAVMGVAVYRNGLLPILSLRVLLGFTPEPMSQTPSRRKVMVIALRGVLVGLLADGVRSVIAADPARLEPIPAMLAARSGGEAKAKAIYRGDDGQGLISVLSLEHLFREDVMARLAAGDEAPGTSLADDRVLAGMVQFLVFSLGGDEFGLPIGAVDEVAGMPEQITRVPRSPKFLEGLVNLRGEFVPVVDQRKRFGMPPVSDGAKRRLVVVRTERRRAALIVDSVIGVLACAPDGLQPTPDLTGEAVRLVNGVINLESQGRIVLTLDPTELLSRTEQSLLDAFEAKDRRNTR